MKKIFCVLFFSSSIFASEISWCIEPWFYADNTEFFNPKYPPGRTILGNSLKTYIRFVLPGFQTFKAGGIVDLRYGDKNIILYPLLQYRVSFPLGFSFIFGNLELLPFYSDYVSSKIRHGLFRSIQSEELDYKRPEEYGFQSLLQTGPLKYDFWINWNLINTREHREWFDFGNNLFLKTRYSRFFVATYISHHGGQLYHTGPVGENIVLSAGTEIFIEVKEPVFQSAGISYCFLADNDIPDRSNKNLSSTGYGHVAGVWLEIFNFKFFAEYFKGKNFIAEEGDPFYKTEKDYVSCSLEKNAKIAGITDFYFKLRTHFIEDNWEYEYKFGFKTKFSVPLKNS